MAYSYYKEKVKKISTASSKCVPPNGSSKDCSKESDFCSNCSSVNDILLGHDDEDDVVSKIADSGLGTCCDRCEKSDQFTRACSCQSFDYTANGCSKRYTQAVFVIISKNNHY